MTKPLVTIRYPKPDRELGRHRVDVIPRGRDALVVWRDQFGSIQMASFGRWGKRKRQDAIEAAVKPVLP